ncbi:hypothetical protein MC885_004871, partial [Smutsia gigantea]
INNLNNSDIENHLRYITLYHLPSDDTFNTSNAHPIHNISGYLQQENLTSACQTFILESSNLKEYAEHCTDEGFIPACLLSLFGKNLTTILNEYVAMKAKETSSDVPAIMSSLWKKLDHTLSQISDNSIAQVPKQTESNPTEPEASFDELLGLQTEIHMSEEAIQDILEQTESDPAFQALFDLFDYGSAIIIASPVQPVLQGMVGMIPVSVVGQNGNTFPAPPRQALWDWLGREDAGALRSDSGV